MSEAATITRAPAPPSPRRIRRVLQSIGALFAGILVNIVVVGAIDVVLRAAGVYPPMFQPMANRHWALALACRAVFAVVGGLITAWLAPTPPPRPIRHALVLGGIETLLSVPFVLVNWDKPDFGPHWFGVSVAASCLPLAALGGMLYAKLPARTHQ